MGKLFGTDGIRGVVNVGLDASLAYRVGRAAALVMAEEKQIGRPVFTIGKDTRISSDLLEAALIAGLCACGADVLRLGVIPTPAVAHLTISTGADAGIVVSASHNPFEHNGIKIFSGQGYKLSDELEEKIEEMILFGKPMPFKTHGDVGRVIDPRQMERQVYVDHLVSTVKEPLTGLRIVVDCANGAASVTAPELFSHFPGLEVVWLHNQPNGVNINDNCGSTHMETLCKTVVEGGYDVGLAFDGDADRFLAVDENGTPVDGDQIMAVCGTYMKREGRLWGDSIVATVMSNLGFHRYAEEQGIRLHCTNVGDRHVLEKMLEGNYSLGGEQSGHLIFREFATTGDGELAALQLLSILCKTGQPLSRLTGAVPQYPQVLINVQVAGNEAKEKVMASRELQEKIARAEIALGGSGRILVRPSGTEALVRVMVEAPEEALAEETAQFLANVIKNAKI